MTAHGTPPTIFFYVSGHGFGHAVRQAEIVRTLVAADPGIRAVVRTSAPAWLFRRELHDAIDVQPLQTDTGVVQIDGLRLDERATVARAHAFHRQLSAFVDAEAALLHRHGAAFVVADAPAAPCAAAAAAGVTAVVCANFTWDWIYAGYRDSAPEVDGLVAEVRGAYGGASEAWRMPLHGGFESFDRIVDIPFVARHPRADLTADDVRRALGLPSGRRLVLVSFGGYGVRDLPLDRLDCTSDWGVVVTAPGDHLANLPPGVYGVPEDRIYANGLQYQDLLHAADVVLSKPGYGIISDCVASGVPLLYTSRGRFAEYEVLVREMPRVLRCRFLEMPDFLAGRWREGLEALAARPGPPERPATDGAALVSRWILERVGRSTT